MLPLRFVLCVPILHEAFSHAEAGGIVARQHEPKPACCKQEDAAEDDADERSGEAESTI